MKKVVIGFIDGLSIENFAKTDSIKAASSCFEPNAINKVTNEFGKNVIDKELKLVFSREQEKHILVITGEYKEQIFYGIGVSENFGKAVREAKDMLFSKTGGDVSYTAVKIYIEELVYPKK